MRLYRGLRLQMTITFSTNGLSIFMTRSEVEAILMRQKDKAYLSSICLDLKPPYDAEVAKNPYQVGHPTPQEI